MNSPCKTQGTEQKSQLRQPGRPRILCVKRQAIIGGHTTPSTRMGTLNG